MYLKATESFAPRQSECDRELAYFCKWSGVTCPPNYSTLGHISDGTSCFNVLETPVAVSPEMCDEPTLDELRHPASPDNKYFTEQIFDVME